MYVFHVIAPAIQIWQKVISQTNIFNIFPFSVPYNTVAKIIQSNCKQQTKKYIPARSMWLNWVFIDLANTDEKHCLTIDCINVNKHGPGRYRTPAGNPDKQVCYFNQPHDDELYNVFINMRIKTGNFEEGIYCKMDRVQGKLENETFDAKKTLEDGSRNDRLSNIFSISKNEQSGRGHRLQTLLDTFSEEIGSQQDQDFQDDKDVQKKSLQQY